MKIAQASIVTVEATCSNCGESLVSGDNESQLLQVEELEKVNYVLTCPNCNNEIRLPRWVQKLS